jgi:di/tricarboxylate transporter
MSLATLSLCALALAVALSSFTQLNVGLLAIALAWIVGVYAGGMPVTDVIAGFPSQLFLTLSGVTLLFTLAQRNGTLDRLANQAMTICRGNRGTIPLLFFVLTGALSSMGPGNIASAALVAPMAMATALRAGIPLFLMAIMVGNGASAGSLSPFAPAGVIVNDLMARMGMPGHEAETYLYNAVAHAVVALGGFILLGGMRLFQSGAGNTAVHLDHDERPPFELRHWITLGAIAMLILAVLFLGVHVGLGAFVASVVVVLTRSGEDREAFKEMPWSVIMMVSGVTVLIAVLEASGGVDLLASLVARIATRESVTAVVAFLTGAISVFSSTSGVVLPALLPMVPDLSEKLGGANPLAIAASINVGGHLVDVSPFSTIGALCIASVPANEAGNLFNKMLAWGLSMAVVGALVCYLLFGRGLS